MTHQIKQLAASIILMSAAASPSNAALDANNSRAAPAITATRATQVTPQGTAQPKPTAQPLVLPPRPAPAPIAPKTSGTPAGAIDLAPHRSLAPTVTPQPGQPTLGTMHEHVNPGVAYKTPHTTTEFTVQPSTQHAIEGARVDFSRTFR